MAIKKEVKNWHVALTHFLTAGLFYPVSFVIIAMIILNLASIIDMDNLDSKTYFLLFPFVVLGIWVGNIQAIKYIDKKYILRNNKNFLNYSILYFLFFSLFSFDSKHFLLTTLLTIIELFAYFFISKKYIAKIIENKE